MTPDHTHLIYFSPTGTTRTILETIAQGMGIDDYQVLNITKEQVRREAPPEFSNDLVLLGAPVYAGRIPSLAAEYYARLKASNTPVILVVLYGNREYEDALLELSDISKAAGFTPLAGAAFIGQHSFSSEALPIAPGRPDASDLDQAEALGRQLKGVLDGVDSVGELKALSFPGNQPYREGAGLVPFVAIQVSDEDCIECGFCMEVCPVNAIDAAAHYAPIPNQCIMCCACIQYCPEDARAIAEGPFMDKVQWLFDNCSVRREPEVFLP